MIAKCGGLSPVYTVLSLFDVKLHESTDYNLEMIRSRLIVAKGIEPLVMLKLVDCRNEESDYRLGLELRDRLRPVLQKSSQVAIELYQM